MKLRFFRKLQYKLRRKIAGKIRNRMKVFNGLAELKDKEYFFTAIRKIEKRIAIYNGVIETFTDIATKLVFSMIALSAIIAPFYLSFRLDVNNPITTALIYTIPCLILAYLLNIKILCGNFMREDYLPLGDQISSVSKWIVTSMILSGLSTFLSPPLLKYIILTPIIIGVGSATFILIYSMLAGYILEKFFWARFDKKYPRYTIVDIFIRILEFIGNMRSENYLFKMELAQLLGEAGETMQRLLPSHLSRVESRTLAFEITDPYVNKLIEIKASEMSMSLKLYAKMILFGDKKNLSYVSKKISTNLAFILNGNWKNYETEQSDEVTALIVMQPLSSRVSKIFSKLKNASIGVLPAGVLLLLQTTKYALPSSLVENVLPFVVTLSLLSVLNLIGADEIVDRAIKAKSVTTFFWATPK